VVEHQFKFSNNLNAMKIKLIILLVLPLLLTGCLNDLFDKGDVEKTYDGPTVVGFFPLQREATLASGATFVQVQLIGEQRTADLAVSYTVSGTSTAVAGTHYTITSPSPVTIAAGTSTVNIGINLIAGSIAAGQNRVLVLELQGGEGVDASANLATARVIIRG
jgi:hypothetical protein